jgi:hypothetical protein
MSGRKRVVLKTEYWPSTIASTRSNPTPQSMFLCGSGTRLPGPRRSNCVNTLFQISMYCPES